MTNAAAIGYAILAAKSLGIDEVTIGNLESWMTFHMDERTEEEAEQVYRNN